MNMSDPTAAAELHEYAESMLNETDAVRLRIFDLATAVAKAPVHELVDLSDELMVQFRKLTNLVEGLADLLDARPVPAVLEFEEVDR